MHIAESTDRWEKSCFFFYFLTAAAKQYNDDLERLQKDLFANYSTNIIPQKVKTIAVKVKFDIALNQIIDLVSFSAVRRNCLNLIHTEWSLLGFYVSKGCLLLMHKENWTKVILW